MTKYIYVGQPADYDGLGFSVVNGGILDGALSTPPITSPPDGNWTVYTGASGETVTRRGGGATGGTVPAVPADGSLLVFDAASRRFVPLAAADAVTQPGLAAALGAAFASQMTTVAKTADYTAGAQEFVEVDATAATVTVTGPAAGAAKRWAVKKVNGTSSVPGNAVAVSYLNSAGVNVTTTLLLAGESRIFRPSGQGYRVESGDTPLGGLDVRLTPLVHQLELAAAYLIGNSYGAGDVVGAGRTVFDKVFSRLRTSSKTNISFSGTRCEQIVAQAKSVPTGFQGVVGISDCILNDANPGNAALTSAAQVRAAFRSIMAYLTRGYLAGLNDTGLGFGPNWTNGTTSTAGSYVDIAWNGDAVTILLGFGTTAGTATIKDTAGNTVQTVNVGGYQSPFDGTVVLSGFGAGNHTVRLSVTSGTVTVLGYLIPSTTAPAVVWWQPGLVARANVAVNQPAMLAAAATDAGLFPTLVTATVGTDWDPATMCATVDQIHLSDKGTDYCAGLIIAKLQTTLTTFREGQNVQTGIPFTFAPNAPAYTSPGATAPAAPTGVTAATGQQLIVNWTRQNDGGASITAQPIRVSSDGGATWVTALANAGATASTAVITTGLTAGTSYIVQVGATNAIGTTWSASSAAATAGNPATTLVVDNFNRADSTTLGTASSGTAWTQGSSTLGITSNQAAQKSTSTNIALITVPGMGADATVQGKVGTTTNDIAIIGRAQDATNNFVLQARSQTTGYVLSLQSGGGFTTLWSGTVPAQPGDVFALRFSGNTITVIINGVTMTTVTNATYNTQAKIGIRPGTATTATLDDLTVVY